jgi:LacI family transcriptional regulator
MRKIRSPGAGPVDSQFTWVAIPNPKPSIADIAHTLGLSQATVSNALTGHRHVSPATAKRVLQLARELGYEGNAIARGLRMQSTKTVGIIVPDITEPYVATVVRHLEQELKRLGYQMLLGSYYFDTAEERKILARLRSFMVDGIISVSGPETNDRYYGEVSKSLPVVFVERVSHSHNLPMIGNDHRAIAASAVDFLYQRGHRRIVHLTIPYEHFSNVRLRAEGFLEGLARNGLEASKSRILVDSRIRLHEVTTSLEIAKTVKKCDATAVFVVSDYVAVGLVKGLSKLNVKIPEEISVMSITNVDYGLVTTPTITSIELFPNDVAKSAAETIMLMISGKPIDAVRSAIPFKIVERESVRRLSK